MSLGSRIRQAAVRVAGSDNPDSLAGRARIRRWEEFAERFPDVDRMRVLDLGGTPRFWRAAPLRPRHVTILNLLPEAADEGWIDSREGDATVPDGDEYDLVFSNSLIEHLPEPDRRRHAAVVLGSAPRHWIQTPNRHFPIEPHWLFPGAQYLGEGSRRWLAENWPASNFVGQSEATIDSEVRNIRLMTPSELAALFPTSEIWRERLGPLTKSLVAVAG